MSFLYMLSQRLPKGYAAGSYLHIVEVNLKTQSKVYFACSHSSYEWKICRLNLVLRPRR